MKPFEGSHNTIETMGNTALSRAAETTREDDRYTTGRTASEVSRTSRFSSVMDRTISRSSRLISKSGPQIHMSSFGHESHMVDMRNSVMSVMQLEVPIDGSSDKYTFAGIFYLFIALLIFSCQSSVFVFLNDIDDEVFTSCNLLCASSICGLLFMFIYLILYRQSISWENDVKTLSTSSLVALFVGSTLYSAVGPYLFFQGLLTASVPMASIIQRLESLNFLILSYLFLRASISYWTLFSASLTLIGVLFAVFYAYTHQNTEHNDASEDSSFPVGYCFIILSGFATSTSLLLSKKYLAHCNVGVIAMSRTFLGSTITLLLTLAIDEVEKSMKHFFSPLLWQYAWVYGFVYIFIGQVSWVTALSVNRPLILVCGINVLFGFSLLWSLVLLGEYPENLSQLVGVSFIFMAIAIAIYEAVRLNYTFDEYEDDGDVTDIDKNRAHNSFDMNSNMTKVDNSHSINMNNDDTTSPMHKPMSQL